MSNGTAFIVIEGIGSDTSYSKGLAFYRGHTPTIANYEFARLLVELPRSLSDEVKPILARTSASSYQFRIQRTPTTAKLLDAPARIPADSISGGITKSATTITTLGGAFASGDVVWVGKEAIKLGTKSGTDYTGSTRGYFGTLASIHSGGAFIFSRPNDTAGRRVIFYTSNDALTSAIQRWVGFIAGTDSDMDTITIECAASPVAQQSISLNRDAADLRRGDPEPYIVARDPDSSAYETWRSFRGELQTDAYTSADGSLLASRVFKPGEAAGSLTAIQIGGALTFAEVSGSSRLIFNNFPAMLGSQIEFDEENRGIYWTSAENAANNTRVGITDSIFEVAVVSKRMDSLAASLGYSDGVSFTRDLDYPYHPLSVVAALWLSDNATSNDLVAYNVLNGDYFGCDLLRFAESTILGSLDALIEATRELEIDQLLLGWDGKPFDAFEEGLKILRAYGFFQTVDTTGDFGFARYQLIDISEYDTAIANTVKLRKRSSDPIRWQSSHEETFHGVSASVGGLPWSDPVEVEVNVDLSSDRWRTFGERRRFTIDFPYIEAGDALELKQRLSSLAILNSLNIPKFSVQVEDYRIDSLDYDLGSVVSIDSLPIRRGGELVGWLLDGVTGEPTTDLDDVQFAGRILGRRFDVETHTYDLTLSMMNYSLGKFGRWRAPSMVVTGWTDNGGGSYTLTCAALSEFGYEDSDAEAFAQFHNIEVFNRDLSPFDSTTWTITGAISGASITTDGPTTDCTGAIVRFAPVDPSVASARTGYYYFATPYEFSNITRSWVVLADDDGTFGDSGEQGDIYG